MFRRHCRNSVMPAAGSRSVVNKTGPFGRTRPGIPHGWHGADFAGGRVLCFGMALFCLRKPIRVQNVADLRNPAGRPSRFTDIPAGETAPSRSHATKTHNDHCLTSDNQEVAHGFRHGVRAIAGPEFCLRLLEMAADSFFAQAERLCGFLQR